MNARRVSAAAGVILAAQKTKQTAAGIAASLDAAGLLQSPETAAELEGLRARVSELEADSICPSQMTTSEGTSKCARRPGHRGDHRNGAKDHYWNNDFADAARDRRPGADAARRIIRARQAEDSHDSPLHHDYAVSRDLPTGGGS